MLGLKNLKLLTVQVTSFLLASSEQWLLFSVLLVSTAVASSSGTINTVEEDLLGSKLIFRRSFEALCAA